MLLQTDRQAVKHGTTSGSVSFVGADPATLHENACICIPVVLEVVWMIKKRHHV